MNYLRGIGFAAENARKTHCPQGHEYTEENTLIQVNGWRQCRTCNRGHSKTYVSTDEYRARRREAREPITGVRGKGQYQAQKGCCKEGHLLEGDNLVLERRKRSNGDVTHVRRCRTCTLTKARDNHAKRKGGVDNRRSDETCKNGHPRTEENTRWTNGKRYCRVCHRERAKESYNKKG
ncbi:hypothetical protein [Streptomyces sp. 5-10]|uniref:hypothetical protein n=1 Tax=Streptomyces sp. 5-10 TaxID=878925 RepID=UPI00168A9B78|nr:hypothetical protein [Streptomyces sp. 5-10]MBD3004511.1 hypothetical protein [Streptomyces sp. 5-10]